MTHWNKSEIFTSTDNNVCKFVFTNDTAVAEAVLYKYNSYENRTVICCSTQSGCPIGCSFCGTGKQFIRNLTTMEIVNQVSTCVLHTKVNHRNIKKFQVMMMSMGEPCLNMSQVIPAITIIHELYPSADILISTSAPRVNYTSFIGISRLIKNIGLQFSVHESTDEARNVLIPFKNKLDLREIAELGNTWFKATKRRPFINYCVHENNSSIHDAYRLYDLFPPEIFNFTLSVICEKEENVKSSIDRQLTLINEFNSKLMLYGYNTRVFNPAGQDDIGGGCGQLWYVQKWMENNSNLITIKNK